MNREDIIKLAREAGFHAWYTQPEEHPDHVAIIERFAALVAAAERNSWPAEMEAMERQVNILTDALAQAKAEEREACAKVAEETVCDTHLPTGVKIYGSRAAAAIRARGQL